MVHNTIIAAFFGLTLIAIPAVADSLKDECDRWHQATGGYGTGCPGGKPLTPELQKQLDSGAVQLLIRLCQKDFPNDVASCIIRTLNNGIP
jgi:hypothetical protein